MGKNSTRYGWNCKPYQMLDMFLSSFSPPFESPSWCAHLLIHNIYMENLMLAKHHTSPPEYDEDQNTGV